MAELYDELQIIYSYYNKCFFNSELPFCQINFCRKTKKSGFFTEDGWKNGYKVVVHEINLNPQELMPGTIEWHAVLVFHMTELWANVTKVKAKEEGYWSKKFVQKLEEIGYVIEKSGGLGGKNSGRKLSYKVKPGGALSIKFIDCPIKELVFQPLPEPEIKKKKKEKKIKYQCPSCESSLWGKQDIIDICWECFELRVRQDIPEEEYSPAYRKKVCITRKVLAFLRGIKTRLYLKVSAEYEMANGG